MSLADDIKLIESDREVIQNLLKRVDVLEATPDATKEMLAEYARDFDTLDNTVKNIIKGINTYQNSENKVLESIKSTVEDYHWIIDESTLNGLKRLVERDTNFSLQKYVAYIQQNAIKAEFSKLHKALQTTVKPLVDSQIAQEKKIQDLQKQNLEYAQQTNQKMQQNTLMMLVITAFSAIIMIFGFMLGFSSFVNSFAKHPVIASIVFVVMIGFLVYLVSFIKKELKGDDDND